MEGAPRGRCHTVFFKIDNWSYIFLHLDFSPNKVKLWRNQVNTVRNFFCAINTMGGTVALRSPIPTIYDRRVADLQLHLVINQLKSFGYMNIINIIYIYIITANILNFNWIETRTELKFHIAEMRQGASLCHTSEVK